MQYYLTVIAKVEIDGRFGEVYLSVFNKNIRLEKLINLLKSKSSLSKEEIADELGISSITVSRDIKAIREKGYKLICKDGEYSITEEPPRYLVETNYSLIHFRLIHLIKYISDAKEHTVSEKELVNNFVQDKKSIEHSKLKVSRKTLMKNLKILQVKGLIRGEENAEKEIYYRLVEADIDKSLSIDNCVNLIQFIRGNIGPLPYNEAFISIADKLENAVVRSLTGYDCFSRDEVIQELGTSYKLFSNGIDNEVDNSQQLILSQLDRLCSQNIFAQIWLKGKVKPIRHFCILLIYQVSLQRWYLAVKAKGKERNFGIIRADKIERIEEVSDVKCDEVMKQRLEIAKQQAYDELINSFGMGLGGKTRVKIRLSQDKDIQDSVLLRLESILCDEFEETADGSLTLTVEIDGVFDFLHWVRGYGSSIIILEPEFVRKMQYEETLKLLEAYEEVSYV
jgi:biotin operon repressor